MSLTHTIRFPLLEGRDLLDNEIILPHHVKHHYALVSIAYKRWHQDFLDTWLPSIEQLSRQFNHLHVYYVSIFKPTNQFMRAITTGYMKRRYVSRADQLAHIIAYTNIDQFNASLDLPNTKMLYLLLIDGSGQVLWRGQNDFDQQHFDLLSNIINSRFHPSRRSSSVESTEP